MVFFALFGIIVNWIAWKKGFYSLPPEKRSLLLFLRFKHVFALFFIYITASFFIPPFLSLLPELKILPRIQALGWIQAITMGVAILLLYVYSQSLEPKTIKMIWKDSSSKKSKSVLNDFITGALCWFLTFPLITVLGYLLDILIRSLFQLQEYEQVAVRFLKMALGNPLLLVVAIFTIVIIAPFVEEYLFRGILQSWLRKHLGRKGDIALSSLIFALFHLAPSQKAGNISLVLSLFTFACFLGFLYEKRRSLFASIGLHMSFNILSALRVLMIKEGG